MATCSTEKMEDEEVTLVWRKSLLSVVWLDVRDVLGGQRPYGPQEKVKKQGSTSIEEQILGGKTKKT